MPESNRLVAVILEVTDLEKSAALYRDGFGLDLHRGSDNDMSGDRWTSGEHASYSWHDGAYLHFSLYQAKTAQSSTLAQIGFMVDDIESAHAAAIKAGAEVVHPPRLEPWGHTARYLDYDGNVVGLTQAIKSER